MRDKADAEDIRWKVLRELLALGDLPAPDIAINEDGDMDLDWWGDVWLTVTTAGAMSWAMNHGHGTDYGEFKKGLLSHEFKLSDFQEQAAEIARLKMEIAKLKAENLELSHTPSRLAEVEAERGYFETELREARQALEQARKEQREKDAEIIAAMPDQPGYS